MHIDHMQLTCTTDDGYGGFICGTAQDNKLFNVMTLRANGWHSKLYHRDSVTLTQDAMQNAPLSLLEKLGFDRPVRPGDKVLWLYTSPRGWNLSAWVPANVVKITAKRVTIETKKPDGSVNRRVSVRPDKLKHDAESQHPWGSMHHPLDIEA